MLGTKKVADKNGPFPFPGNLQVKKAVHLSVYATVNNYCQTLLPKTTNLVWLLCIMASRHWFPAHHPLRHNALPNG